MKSFKKIVLALCIAAAAGTVVIALFEAWPRDGLALSLTPEFIEPSHPFSSLPVSVPFAQFERRLPRRWFILAGTLDPEKVDSWVEGYYTKRGSPFFGYEVVSLEQAEGWHPNIVDALQQIKCDDVFSKEGDRTLEISTENNGVYCYLKINRTRNVFYIISAGP